MSSGEDYPGHGCRAPESVCRDGTGRDGTGREDSLEAPECSGRNSAPVAVTGHLVLSEKWRQDEKEYMLPDMVRRVLALYLYLFRLSCFIFCSLLAYFSCLHSLSPSSRHQTKNVSFQLLYLLSSSPRMFLQVPTPCPISCHQAPVIEHGGSQSISRLCSSVSTCMDH